MSWIELGDIGERGAFLVREDSLSLSARGFRATAVATLSDPASPEGLLVVHGDLVLSTADMASALDAVGASLEDGEILRPDHHGRIERIALGSPEGLRELCHAAMAFGGIESDGGGRPVDPERDPPVREIMRREVPGFDGGAEALRP